MRILLIGNSNESRRRFDDGKLRHEVAADLLEAELGERQEMIVKGYWPDRRAPEAIARWIDETDPDLIYIHIGNYPFTYRSVPLRFKRIFRRVGGEPIAEIGERAGKNPRWAHRWWFRAGRRFLQRTVGGDTNFSREQVWTVTAEILRVAVRKEGAIVVVKGPHGRNNYAFSARQFRNDERERVRLHDDLEDLCEQLHITYNGIGEGGVYHMPAYGRGTNIGDDVHGNAIRHAHEGEVIFETIKKGLVEAGRLPAPP